MSLVEVSHLKVNGNYLLMIIFWVSERDKSFYSLRGLGCKPSDLSPKMIAIVFKQFCQPIIKYGFENLYLNESKLRLLNIRQNILLKRTLGLSIFCRTKPLF